MPPCQWPDHYIEWGQLERPRLVSILFQKLLRFRFLREFSRDVGGEREAGFIAHELAEGGVTRAFDLAHRLQPFTCLFVSIGQFRQFLQPYGYRQALRLLPEHPEVTPWFNELAPEPRRVLFWLYEGEFDYRDLAVTLGIRSDQAKRQAHEAFDSLCNLLRQGGWGDDSLPIPPYPCAIGTAEY